MKMQQPRCCEENDGDTVRAFAFHFKTPLVGCTAADCVENDRGGQDFVSAGGGKSLRRIEKVEV